MNDIVSAFLSSLSAHSIELTDPTTINADGEKHRARVAGDRKPNLVYQIHNDERPAGWFEDYKRGVFATFSAATDKPLSQADVKRLQAEREAAKIERESQRQQDYDRRAHWAASIYKHADGDPMTHPYAVKKSWVAATGIRRISRISRAEFFDVAEQDGALLDALIIPCRAADGAIRSIQAILPDGTKLFPKRCQQRGLFFPIKGEGDTVLVCEGVATAIALHAASGYSVLAAMSSGNIKPVAEHAAQKKTVIVCPDNDHSNPENPGLAAVAGLPYKIVPPPFTPSADPAHTDWDDYLRHHGEADDLIASLTHEPAADDYSDIPIPEDETDDGIPAQYLAPQRDEPFRILGYNRSTCYYLPDGFRQVVALPTRDHSKLRLLELAPLSFWKSHFIDDSKRSGDRTDWHLAAESLIRRAQRAGIWDDDKIRGRGAWWDDGRAAVHLGDRVIVDGTEYPLGDAPGKFVYELNTRIDLATDDPLLNSESMKLTEICEGLRWQRPISGKLLAGWVFLAPICGALEWRPHLWITGPAGSGKSTITKHVIHRILQGNMIFVQGETSEAGLRQELGHDAIPVVFDEIESQDEKATNRVNSIMDLMTIASSETGAKLVKGGANGKAQSYMIRSMFCFSSISVNLKQHAAKTRVTVLDMRPKPDAETAEDIEQYNRMLDTIYTTLTPEYTRRLQARAVSLIPVIRHNSRVFSEAAAMVVGSRRFGDQVGALLAGAYALQNRGEVTPKAARQFVESQQWEEEADIQETKDERACIQHILAEQVTVDTKHGPKRRSIGELVDLCAAGLDEPEGEVTVASADLSLKRCGLTVLPARDPFDGPRIAVANNHKTLAKILAGSPWANSWSRTIMRITGAEKRHTMRFAGVTSKAVSVPIASIE